MNTPFEIQAFDLNQIGRHGSGRISALVNGYWSSDPASLYISRTFNYSPAGEDLSTWKVEISHSSGGRQTDPAKERGVVSDLDAAVNLGCALIALAALGRQIEARFPELSAAHAAERAERAAQRAAEEAAKAERIAADPAIGLEKAADLVAIAVEQARNVGNTVECVVLLQSRPRGQEANLHNTYTLTVLKARWSNKVIVRFNGAAMKRADAIAKFAELSAAALVLPAKQTAS